jgi:hypothetical protein
MKAHSCAATDLPDKAVPTLPEEGSGLPEGRHTFPSATCSFIAFACRSLTFQSNKGGR